ncbi:MAG: sialate O-acetylesterase, partial [Ginsengibacter sp.]
SVGGSYCQAWVSRDTLTADPLLYQKYLFPYDTSSHSKEPLDSVVTFEKVVRPALFYNAMIYPLKNIQFKGALWYQGESNRYDSSMYTRLCAAMIRNWRTLFTNKALPFYYVQVAPYNWQQNDTTLYEYALLREAQANVRKVVDNTEMAVTMDIADPLDIHPRNKQDLGYRLAKIALTHVYNIQGTVCNGPEYSSHRVENGVVKIAFKHKGSGLMTNDGAPPRHFFIAGKNGVFYYADAKIENNEIWLQSDKVKEPVAIRYAFTNYPVTNLENKEGFPAIPFRSSF